VVSGARDAKWRFFWRVGDRPAHGETKFPQLNAAQVVPRKFEAEWADVLDTFGAKLVTTLYTTAEMLALGLGLDKAAIADKMANGPHLLAPTGVDLSRHSTPGDDGRRIIEGDGAGAGDEGVGAVTETVVAACHYDLNLLTIHAKAVYPGLYIWTRGGKRLPVSVPAGALLVQAGAQLEHLTGGAILRGFHEVVVDEKTVAAVTNARAVPGKSLWRVSSTLFAHVQSDQRLRPLGQYADECGPVRAAEFDVLAGDQVAAELRAIALSADVS
jgi:isopenicillin N synthase-like dioxygenase